MDLYITSLINGFSGQSESIDFFVRMIASNHLFKGTFAMMLFWACWFYPTSMQEQQKEKQAGLISVLIATLLAMSVSRISSHILPFRLRPIISDVEVIQKPIGMNFDWTNNMSAFPSDHAAMFFSIAMGIFLINRNFGAVALIHAVVIVCLPRVFLGLHWVSDIIAGAILGSLMAVLLVPFLQRKIINLSFLKVPEQFSPWVYAILFLITAQATVMFQQMRDLAGLMVDVIGL